MIEFKEIASAVSFHFNSQEVISVKAYETFVSLINHLLTPNMTKKEE